MDDPAGHQLVLAQRTRDLQTQFERLLAGRSEFVWEIGCGHGHFLTAYAKEHPDQLCIGIDLSTERIDRATRKRNRSKLPNLHFIQAEARLFLEALPPGVGFSDVYVLFPDPWPKLRHRKHRLMQPDFLRAVAAKAGPSARLFFRTDFEPYFTSVEHSLGESAGWGRVEDPWPFVHETVFQARADTFHSLCARPLHRRKD